MITTADLLREVKRLNAEATWIAGNASKIPWPMLARIRSVVPQLAEAYVALHANVRKWAIPIEGHCYLCNSDWTRPSPRLGPMAIAAVLVYGPETHAPDCPARPMEPGT